MKLRHPKNMANKRALSSLDLDVSNQTKKKSKRQSFTRFTEKQVQCMEAHFSDFLLNNTVCEESLVEETGLKLIQIKRWMRQRRFKAKHSISSNQALDSPRLPPTNMASGLVAIPISTDKTASNLPPQTAGPNAQGSHLPAFESKPPSDSTPSKATAPKQQTMAAPLTPTCNSSPDLSTTIDASNVRPALPTSTPAFNVPPASMPARTIPTSTPTCNSLKQDVAVSSMSTALVKPQSPCENFKQLHSKPATVSRSLVNVPINPGSRAAYVFPPNQAGPAKGFYPRFVSNNVVLQQQSYDNCQQTLQLCDKLLQDLFGCDWLINLRLHRNV